VTCVAEFCDNSKCRAMHLLHSMYYVIRFRDRFVYIKLAILFCILAYCLHFRQMYEYIKVSNLKKAEDTGYWFKWHFLVQWLAAEVLKRFHSRRHKDFVEGCCQLFLST
jgi:hypothetical protein